LKVDVVGADTFVLRAVSIPVERDVVAVVSPDCQMFHDVKLHATIKGISIIYPLFFII
jgi:hypothetical protein